MAEITSKNEIEDFTKELGIPYLVHFTHISNLESIVTNGLLSREKVDALEHDAMINDELRLDGHRETISISIAHPNDKMFYRYRENDTDWCVLAISPKIMWKCNCLFYKHNAADARVSSLPTDYLSSLDALKSMFEEDECLESRENQRLKSYDPTDVQAEILVIDNILPVYIFGVVVSNELIKNKFSDVNGNAKIIINTPNKGVYATRSYRRKYQ